MKHVVVIGAGLGGLATSIRLAHAGYRVTLLEKNGRVGGKMDIWEQGGYRFDTGPSLLTMPFVLRDLFQTVGERMEDHLELVPIEPICRYFWQDGSCLNASADLALTIRGIGRLSRGDAGNVEQFLEHGRKIYDAAFQPFLLSAFGSMKARELFSSLKHLPSLAKIDAMRSLNDAVEAYFTDGKIRQLFNRFATYNGSSPYLAPATLALIPYVEFTMGGWYTRGGMYSLAHALQLLALRLGVEIRTGVEVGAIVRNRNEVRGVETESGGTIEADVVVSNADALYAERRLLDNRAQIREIEPSLAGFVLVLGVRRFWPELAHHNVFFSDDYREEFDAMFRAGQPSRNPTIYVCNTSRTDRGHAPAGCSNLFVLVNAPPLPRETRENSGVNWESFGKTYRDLVIRMLEQRGLSGLEDAIEVERVITPAEFERHYNAYRGSIYGTSSNSRLAAFLRPPNRSRMYRNLYFVGGSSHPGGGIPLVLLSGQIVADMIRREHCPS